MVIEGHVGAAVASSQSQASQKKKGSATQQMVDELDLVQDDLEASGNFTGQITERWICKLRDCRRYSKLCYWGVRDEERYHLPISAQLLSSWSKGIVKKKLTSDAPSPAMV